MTFFRYALIAMVVSLFCLSSGPVLAQEQNPVVVLQTDKGNIFMMLYKDKAPTTVKNFLAYVKAGFYDGTVFHRVVTHRYKMGIVQGGGYDSNIRKKRPLFRPIKNEAVNGLSNEAGAVAMARGANPDSATCEFFINIRNNRFLDWGGTGMENFNSKPKTARMSIKAKGAGPKADNPGYAVFGRVIRGMNVVKNISEGKTKKKGLMEDVPVEPVVIKKAFVYKG